MYFRTSISAAQLKQLLPQSPLIVDIREPYEFTQFHFPTAKNIPYRTLLMYPEKYLNPTKTYYLICGNGSKSSRASVMLNDMGYTTINIYDGYNV